MKNDLIYLDTYTLQQDMRIRLPKSVLSNMNIEKGKTKLEILFDKKITFCVEARKLAEDPDEKN